MPSNYVTLKMRGEITKVIRAIETTSEDEVRLLDSIDLTRYQPKDLADMANLPSDSVWYKCYCLGKPEYAIMQFDKLSRPEYTSRMRSDVRKIADVLIKSVL